jgi:NitT/TauT family transport system substrate-binding protein
MAIIYPIGFIVTHSHKSAMIEDRFVQKTISWGTLPITSVNARTSCQGKKMIMKRRSLLANLGLFVSAIVLMVSCGKSDVQAPNPTQSATISNITVGFSAWPGWLPWQVTQEAGLFKSANVKFQWFDNYLDSIKALQSGAIQANSQSLNDTIAAIATGSDQVVVLVNDNSTGNDKIIARPGISTTAELKGKKIAVEAGTVDHFLLMLGLKKAGLTEKDIEIVNLETSKAAAAFVAGQVDAAAVFAPFTTEAFKRSGSKELFSSKDFPGSVVDHLVVNRTLINEHPEQVQALVDSWFATLEYMKKNTDQTIAIKAKRAGVSVPEYQQYANGTKIFNLADNLKALHPALSSSESLASAALDVAKFMVDAKLSPNLPKLDRMFDDRFVKAYAAKKSKA